MASPAYRDLWRMLSNVSSSLRKFASPGRTSASLGHDTISDPNPHHPFPPLTLDVPTDFTAFLYDFQISQQALERLLSRADKTVNDLKALHIKSYNGMCNKFYKPDQPSTSSHPKALFDGIKCSHEMAFQRELGRVREEFIKAYEQLRPLSQPKKAVFNTEYTPLLEQYFEYNAFPSARDRDVLARKSSMTARQIEVWFQNHRRRARKDGIQLKRMSSCPLPATLSLERLEKEMPLFIVPKKEKRSTSVDLVVDSEIPEHISPNHRASSPPSRIGNLLDTFSSSTPTTFPAMYRPPGADSENSFFRTARWTFSAPVWRRKPSVLPGKHRTCTSLEDLCTSFSSKLHIAGGVPRKQKDYKHLGRRSTTSSRLPAFSPPHCPWLTAPQNPVLSQCHTTFGRSTPLRSRVRHRPYDGSSRKYPTWTVPEDHPPPLYPRPRLPIPRMSSCSSISSNDSWGDPPTPGDSPSAFDAQLSSSLESCAPEFTVLSQSNSNLHPPVRLPLSKPNLYSSVPSLSFIRVTS